MVNFDYDKAEADLYESGCRHSEEVFDCQSKRDFDSFIKENDLDPEDYYRGNSHTNDIENGSNHSGCYLTSACVKARNLPDDCEELQILRNYRDTYLKERKGREDIEHYYNIAPLIVAAVDSRSDAANIWSDLYDKLIVPCVMLIKNQDQEAAYRLYKDKTEQMEKLYLI